jgi:hypothetical protein
MTKEEQDKIDKISARYSDWLLTKYQDFGEFSHEDLRSEKHIQVSPEDKAIYDKYGLEWYPTISGFMINNGYFLDHEFDKYFSVTEKGNLVKELGGHAEYRKYRAREINVIRNQWLVNALLITATFVAALSPILVELIKNKGVKEPVTQPVPSVIVKIDTSLLSPYIEGQKSKASKPVQSSPTATQLQKQRVIQPR